MNLAMKSTDLPINSKQLQAFFRFDPWTVVELLLFSSWGKL
jgi:hypothetical protein